MKKRYTLMILAALLIIIPAVTFIAVSRADTTLEFQFQDKVSGEWVWGATAVLQNRMIRSHFQTDQGPAPYTFTHLRPGEAVLEISAPHYVTRQIPVTLKRGSNRIDEPVELVGYEIPNLSRWVIFEEWINRNLALDLRPISTTGRAVVNHPCLDIWLGARISAQVPADSEAADYRRGEVLFTGQLEWRWDPTPESTYRYYAWIPGTQIASHTERLWVVDYVLIVPDPRKITSSELDQIMARAWEQPLDEIESYLRQYTSDGRLTPYIFSSWNVEGAGL